MLPVMRLVPLFVGLEMRQYQVLVLSVAPPAPADELLFAELAPQEVG